MKKFVDTLSKERLVVLEESDFTDDFTCKLVNGMKSYMQYTDCEYCIYND